MRWSERSDFGPPEEELLGLRRRALGGQPGGPAPADLSVTNPTRVGLDLPPLGGTWPMDSRYEPDPQGSLLARTALARAYSGRAPVRPEDFCLFSSTSEGYLWLFHSLCDPGDAVLAPSPSYPLLDQIATSAGVHLELYPLHYAGGWDVDLGWLPSAEELVRRRVRAVVAVSPNNPTGSLLTADEFAGLAGLGLPLIVDEVFRPYLLRQMPAFDPLSRGAPVFVLDGLSKRAAAPGLKLGWVLASGPRDFVQQAMGKLGTFADTLLSTSALAQNALPSVLAEEKEVQAIVLSRLRDNLRRIERVAEGAPFSLLDVQAGFLAILRLPAVFTEDEVLERLASRAVWAQPGRLYDLPMSPTLVVSLLTEPAVLARGIEEIAEVTLAACRASGTGAPRAGLL